VFSRTNGNTEDNHGRTFILEDLARDSELSAISLYNINLGVAGCGAAAGKAVLDRGIRDTY
jgi:hypothetical protein